MGATGGETGLTISLDGEQFEFSGDSVTFGRQADLVVDEANAWLHRVTGRFVRRDGIWWLQNHARRLSLAVEDRDAGTTLTIAAGHQFPVPLGAFHVRFGVGRANYRLDCLAHGAGEVDAEHGWWDVGGDGDDRTVEFGPVPLSGEQHLLCVALCASSLLGETSLPSNAELATQLGWTVTKFNRKLDYLCVRLTRAGVVGLRGDLGRLATDRRRVLVEHVLSQGIVTRDDLALLRSASLTTRA